MKHTLKTIFLISCFWLLIQPSLVANHLIGGQLSYTHQGGNNYRITLELFRDCDCTSCAELDETAYITLRNPSGMLVNENGNLASTGVGVSDPIILEPVIEEDPCFTNIPDICLEQGVYRLDVTLPDAPGVYKAIFQRCCRNNTIDNIFAPGDTGATYEIDIPHNTLNANNNSATFYNYPPAIICADFPLVYDHSASDPDGDSLVYSMYTPFDGASVADPQPFTALPYGNVNWLAGYDVDNQIGGTEPLAIDSETGLLTGLPTELGQYVVGIQVTEYRDGMPICTNRRDFQFNVTDCNQVLVTPGGEAELIAPSQYEFVSCGSFVYNFEGTDLGTTDPGVTFEWIPENPNEVVMNFPIDSLNPIVTYPDTGTYQISIAAALSNNTCTDTATVTLYLYPIQDLEFEYVQGDCGEFLIDFEEVTNNPHFNSWSWTFGDLMNPFDNVSTEVNPSHTYSEPGTYFVSLTIENIYGCAAIVEQAVIIPNPVDAIISPISPICVGDQASLNGSYDGGINEDVSFFWGTNNDISDVNLADQTVSPEDDTWYYFYVETVSGCTSQDSILVEVLAFPEIETIANANICLGESIELTTTVTGDFDNFQWTSSGDAPVGNVLSPMVAPTEETWYYLEASNILCDVVDSVLVSITFPFDLLEEDLVSCEGEDINLNIATEENYSYLWSPANLVDDATAENQVVNLTEYAWLYVSGEANNCFHEDSVFIDILKKPVLELLPDTFICVGEDIELTSTINGDFNNFAWSNNLGTNVGNLISPTVMPTDSTIYILQANNALCETIDSVKVAVVQAVEIEAAADITICEGDTARLTVTTPNGFDYTWSPAESLNNPNAIKPVATPSVTTTYSISIANECFSASDELVVNVNPLPIVDAGDDIEITIAETATLNGYSDASFTWSPTIGLSNPNSLQPTADPNQTITYYLEGTNGICKKIDSVTVFVDASIYVLVPSAFSPNNDGLNDVVRLYTNGIEDINSFAIYNRWGREVYKGAGFDATWDGFFEGEEQLVGVYIYYVEAVTHDGNTIVEKGNVTLIR